MTSTELKIREIILKVATSQSYLSTTGLLKEVEEALSEISKLFMTKEEVEKVLRLHLYVGIKNIYTKKREIGGIESASKDLASKLCVGKV